MNRAGSDWTLSASARFGVYTSRSCFGSRDPAPRSLRRVFEASVASGSDARQIRVNKMIERTVERLHLGYRVMRQAKAASLRELAMTPGRAQRLSPNAVAVGSVAVSLAELGHGRPMDALCVPTGTSTKEAFRAKRVIAQGYPAARAGKLDSTSAAARLGAAAAGGPRLATAAGSSGARIPVPSSSHRSVCLGAVAEAAARLNLSTAFRADAATIAGRAWDSGALEGSMPRSVAAGALLVASARRSFEGSPELKLTPKAVAAALGIHASTARNACKKTANVVGFATAAAPQHAAGRKAKTEDVVGFATAAASQHAAGRKAKTEAGDEDPDDWDTPSFSF